MKKKIASVDNISDEERQQIINSGEYQPSYMWNVNGCLADKLHLHITNQTPKCIPMFCNHDIHSNTLNIDIKTGDATGMSAIVTTTTQEEIIVSFTHSDLTYID